VAVGHDGFGSSNRAKADAAPIRNKANLHLKNAKREAREFVREPEERQQVSPSVKGASKSGAPTAVAQLDAYFANLNKVLPLSASKHVLMISGFCATRDRQSGQCHPRYDAQTHDPQ
jgi:hypothetical protein